MAIASKSIPSWVSRLGKPRSSTRSYTNKRTSLSGRATFKTAFPLAPSTYRRFEACIVVCRLVKLGIDPLDILGRIGDNLEAVNDQDCVPQLFLLVSRVKLE